MSEAKHWVYEKDKDIQNFDDYVIKESGSIEIIARVFVRDHAEYIVRACNAYNDLLEACELLQSALTEYNLRDIKKRYSLCVADAAASKAIAKAKKG